MGSPAAVAVVGAVVGAAGGPVAEAVVVSPEMSPVAHPVVEGPRATVELDYLNYSEAETAQWVATVPSRVCSVR